MSLGITAVENDSLDSPGVDVTVTDGHLYPSIRVDRSHVGNLYETQVVRGLSGVTPSSASYYQPDYEMPLDEAVVYTAFALDVNGDVTLSVQSAPVTVEVPFHRVVVRSVGNPGLSRRVQITEFKEFTRALRILQEAKVLGVQDPVITFDVMEGMTGSFQCMNILDQEAAGLALRTLFSEGQPLMFQSVMRNSGIPDFFFLATQMTPGRVGAIGDERVPRYLYSIEFRQVERLPATVTAGSLFTWQTLLDVDHLTWTSVDTTHVDWLSVLVDTDKPPV